MNSKKTVTFKQWSNKSWGVFNSIGKQIRIALLPLSYFLTSFLTLSAQQDTIPIDDVQIISSRVPTKYSELSRVIYTIEKEEIESLPVHSLQDLIEYASNVDVRQRGTEGVQADISIRGGNFDQSLILLNGFKMNDVQTGHHNMNLPVDIESIERIEILQGPGNRVFGNNAYSGAINFITSTKEIDQINLSLYGGQYNFLGGSAGINLNYKNWHNYFAVSAKKSDGYLSNDSINNTDFTILNLFYESSLKTQVADFIIQAGYTDKSFGANSFYTPAFPWQYENTKTIFAGYKTVRNGKNYNFLKSFFWRRHQDRFELYRAKDKYIRTGEYFIFEKDTAATFYKGHNYHKTNIISSELKYGFESVIGKSAIGAEYQHAFIQSNVLGEDMEQSVDVPFEEFGEYTKEADRYNVNIYAEHVFTYKQFMIAGGFSSNYNSDYKWNHAGGADLSYNFSKVFKIFSSFNQALRLPTYTDLYYDGPTNKGNPDLLPEKSMSYEAGLRYTTNQYQMHLNGFRRDGKNTIDWVRQSDSLEWQPQNITELTTYGIEFSGSYKFSKDSYIKKIAISYSYITMNKLPNDFESKYVLDFLKHKAVFSLHHKLFGKFAANWNVRYEDRNEQYLAYNLTEGYTELIEYKPFIIADIKIYWTNDFLEIYTEATNFLNTEYYDFGNIKMPGRWIKAGVRLKLNL